MTLFDFSVFVEGKEQEWERKKGEIVFSASLMKTAYHNPKEDLYKLLKKDTDNSDMIRRAKESEKARYKDDDFSKKEGD